MLGKGQLALDVRHHRAALERDDFLVASANAEAVAWVDAWPDWPNPVLIVHGPAASGKTHLAHVFAQASGAPILAPAEAAGKDPMALLAGLPALVVDDADQGVDEETLLHLINAARETERKLLLTARHPPIAWPLALPDLRSRLLAAPTVAIHEPGDDLMAALLVKLFADRQLRVGEGVVEYICRRMERSFAAARALVEAIDARALAERREVTIPFVREVLEGF